ALEDLRGSGLGEAALIATCDRVELLAATSDAPRAAAALSALLVRRGAAAPETVARALYRHEGAAALRHLFAVASALDGLVIGEPQVLGQVKEAHRLATELGLAGAELEAAFAAAFAAARRVRRETRIAELRSRSLPRLSSSRATSMSSSPAAVPCCSAPARWA